MVVRRGVESLREEGFPSEKSACLLSRTVLELIRRMAQTHRTQFATLFAIQHARSSPARVLTRSGKSWGVVACTAFLLLRLVSSLE